MATKPKKPANTNTKKRTPFIERFSKRIEKMKEFAVKTQTRFATAPDSDVADSLEAIKTSADTILESLPNLKNWTPPTRPPAFAVGDSVVFKKDRLEELVKSGLYDKKHLDGKHEILAVAGRRLRLSVGMFQSIWVTKSA